MFFLKQNKKKWQMFFYLCIPLWSCSTYQQQSVDASTLLPESSVQSAVESPEIAVENVLSPALVSTVPENLSHLPPSFFVKKSYKQRMKEKVDLSFLTHMDHEMIWPLKKVEISSSFGLRGRRFHGGVDLKAKKGTPVYASSDGVVVYAGSRISGYGKMVILRHKGDFATLYGHNQTLLVEKGEYVFQGQQIALSGSTGRSSGPHLHFEVRHGVHPIDPMKVALEGSDRFRLPILKPTKLLAVKQKNAAKKKSKSFKGKKKV